MGDVKTTPTSTHPPLNMSLSLNAKGENARGNQELKLSRKGNIKSDVSSV